MTFENRKDLVDFITRHHNRFGGHAIEHAAYIIDRAWDTLRDNPEITGITYNAMQNAEGYGKLVTLITIGMTTDGEWTYIERIA